MTAEELSITTTLEGGDVIVRIAGEVDLQTADVLVAALAAALEQTTQGVSVHLGEVSFIDSSGVRVLLDSRAAALEQGRSFRVLEPSTVVARLFDITGLNEILGLEP